MLKTKRGGGPKTPEGKLAAASNSLKTGVYSRSVVLPGESEQEFQQLLEQFNQDFAPVDVAEASIIRELAVLTWKRLRLERIERASLLREMNNPIKHHELSRYGIKLGEDCEWLINDLSTLTPEYVQTHKIIHKFILSLNGKRVSRTDLANVPAQCPEFAEAMYNLADEYWEYDKTKTSFVKLAAFKMTDFGYEQNLLDYALETLQEEAERVIDVESSLELLKFALKDIKEKRLLDKMLLERPSRANEDLSRAFFRTLAELRRQQKWRKDMGIVDVEEVSEEESDSESKSAD